MIAPMQEAVAAFMDAYAAVFSLAVMLCVFVGLVVEWRPPEVTASAGAGAMLLLGLVDADSAIGVFSNSAPLAIAGLFIVSGAMLRTGLLDAASSKLMAMAMKSRRLATATALGATSAASAFINNTPVVMVMTPVMRRLARAVGVPPSKLLIPVSYAAIMGGTCTLIGTSTSLLVDGVSQAQGLAPFSMFEITGLGVILVAVVALYMTVAGNFLLPTRASLSDALEQDRKPRFIAEVVVPLDSPLIGLKLEEAPFFRHPDVSVLDVVRTGSSRRHSMGVLTLKAGDRIVVETPAAELLGVREGGRLEIGPARDGLQPVSTGELAVVEALIGPGRGLVGRPLGDLDLPARFGVFPLAIHRRGRNIGGNFENERLEVGDTVLLEGSPEGLGRVATRFDLLGVTEFAERPFRRRRAPVALAVIVGIVALAALDVMPIAILALLGAIAVLVTRCIDVEEALASIDGRILVLIFAMLVIGRGLESSGAIGLIVDVIEPLLRAAPPWLALACVYALTSILTEMVTNNAVAVVVTPVAVALAVSLGYDPRPFVVAVIFGASAAFATPIGYQTNTMVYMAGGYKFIDFIKVGVPLNIVVGAATVLLIPLFWPL